MNHIRYISLGELQGMVKKTLFEGMPLSYWITAEISEVNVNYSGHCFMELVEKGDGQLPKARADAVIWRSVYGAVRSYFVSVAGCEFCEGMKVLLKVSVNYHELYGLSLVVTDIDPAYTIGDMERQRRQTIMQLQQEGVFDMNRTAVMSPVIQRIAVVSSASAAGYRDFMQELSASGFRFETTLFDAFVQGREAEESVVSALERIAECEDSFDAVVIIRGGGSQSDLSAFDSYRLCSHIAQFPLPVITGIGHDKDRSVADLVAAEALKTPTAVAAWLADRLAGLDAWFGERSGELTKIAAELVEGEKRSLLSSSYALMQKALGFTRSMEIKFERTAGELGKRAGMILAGSAGELERLSKAVADGSSDCLLHERKRVDTAEKLACGYSPDRILALGFAIVRHGGRAVKNDRELKTGDKLDIRLSEGSVKADVT